MEGLFTTPSQLRDARLADLMKQRQAMNTGMGGSMAGLLGQVAAGGALTGQMLAESAGSMFGLKTAEEDRAAQMQDLLSQFDTNTPEGVTKAARLLNNQGFTNEALALVKHKGALLGMKADELSIQKAERDLGDEQTRTVFKPVTKYMANPSDPYGPPLSYTTSMQVTQVKRGDKWVDIGGVSSGSPTRTGSVEVQTSGDEKPKVILAPDEEVPSTEKPEFTPEQRAQIGQQFDEFRKTLAPQDYRALQQRYADYASQTLRNGEQPVPFDVWTMTIWAAQ